MATAKKDQFNFPDENVDGKEVDAPDISLKLEDGTEIEIVDDTPAKDRGRKPLQKKVDDPTDEELEQHTAGVRARIKELTHARHDERRRAETVERERDEAAAIAQRLLEENRTLKKQYASGAQAFGTVQKEAAEASLKAAKAALKKAHEDFDNDAIADAQEEVARATYRVEQAKNFRAPPVQAEEDDVQTRQPQQQVPQLDRKSQDWRDKNRWFGAPGFEEYTSYALGLHQRLVTSGVDPRSDDYYARINSRMKSAFPELFEEDGTDVDASASADTQPPAKKPPTVVAPTTRTPAGPGKVRLTSTQIALCKRLGITPQVYAMELLKEQKEGQ